ncbi:MAG: polysaccharide biosynthesis/export family protein [Alphaproteobacteria bacterium]|nr:polysaccharide biosynthesis/export family protein [Alphaproteobacteria bacterium]
MNCFRLILIGLLLISAPMLQACETVQTEDVAAAPQAVIPVLELPEELPPYRLQIGDVLDLKMLLNPELDEEVTIRPDGKISTAVAQDIMAYGKTPEELQAVLNMRYETHLNDPNVAVIVRSFAPSRVYVLGEVNNPGEYIAVGQSLTMLQALSMAGNVKNSAKTDDIVIIRRGGGEQPKAYVANYDEATTGLNPMADVRLVAGDVVFVPRTAVAEAYVNYEQSVQQFIRPAFNMGLTYRLDNYNN